MVRRRIKGMVMAGKQFSLDSRMDLVSTLNKGRDGGGENGSENDGDVDEEKGRLNSVS